MTASTIATAAIASGPGVTLSTLRRMLDNFDDEVDAMADFPFIGSFAAPVRSILDPIRKAVDGGVVETIRKAIDNVDNEIAALSKMPLIGGYVTGIASLVHSLRTYVDAADPGSPVAAVPAAA